MATFRVVVKGRGPIEPMLSVPILESENNCNSQFIAFISNLNDVEVTITVAPVTPPGNDIDYNLLLETANGSMIYDTVTSPIVLTPNGTRRFRIIMDNTGFEEPYIIRITATSPVDDTIIYDLTRQSTGLIC